MRVLSRAAILAAVLTCLGASPASASVTVSTSGSTVFIGSATGSNQTYIDFNASNQLTIQNTDGTAVGIDIAAGDSGGCNFDGGDPNNKVDCPATFGDIQATYGGGNDEFRFLNVCVPTATVNMGEGTNRYTGQGCDPSTITVSGGSGQDTFIGSSDGVTKETFLGGGGDDTLQGYAGDDDIHGGEGNDTVDGGTGNDGLFGDGGTDQIAGREGNDTEDGGPGDDRMGFSPAACCTEDRDSGADDVRGGDGRDELTLEDHDGGMAISLDDQINDGSAGEGDNIHSDLEVIFGTGANDVFVGTPGADDFSGGSGNDEVHGAGGDDLLSGSGGDDRIFGDAGNDKVQGREGSDMVDGGSGSDKLYGDKDSCTFSCSFDPDQLFARDGELDTVDCGGGADQAQVDQLDIVAFCTSVDRQTVAVPGGAGAGPGAGAGGAAAALGLIVPGSIRSKALLKRGLAFRLTCPGACKIAAELRYKAKKLGSARKTLLKAGTAKLVVKISRKARRTVRRLKRGKLTLRVKVTDAAGKTTSLTKTIRFRH